MSYSRVFKNIKAEAVETLKHVIPDIWKVPPEDQELIMKRCIEKWCEIYSLPVPAFEFRSDDEEGYNLTGGGCYNPILNKITLFKKASVVTLAHEFRHMMQYKKEGLKLYKGDHEHDARAWSVSLFRMASPKAYRKAVDKGILHFK